MIGHIAIFMPDVGGGGAERVNLNLAKGFVEAVHRVDLVLSDARGEYLNVVPNSVRIVNLGAGRVLKSIFPLSDYLRRESPDALLSGLNYANLVALWARRLSGVKTRCIVSLHNTLSQVRDHPQGFADRIIPYLVKWFFPRADAIVAVSEGVREDFCQVTGIAREKVKVIYNPVITDELLQLAEEEPTIPWLRESVPVILGVGRLREQKNFANLINAFARVVERKQARLLILGEGEQRRQLEQQVSRLGLESLVSLPGFIANPYACLKHASVFALSSDWEGLPTVLIEALACGTQVVSTNCPSGPFEILNQGELGALVPMKDTAALADAICHALDHPETPSRKNLHERFGYAAVTEAYLGTLLRR